MAADDVRVWPGERYPLGARFDGIGTNFSVFSEVAEKVQLSLFDDGGRETCVELREVTGHVWHGYLPGIRPGQRYGYRVHGPWDPARGHRCNPSKLLLDPYAKAIDGAVRWNEAVYPYRRGSPDERNEADSAPFVPRSVVADAFFDWRDDRRPRTPIQESIVYELHVKGFTRKHPDVPPELRGTYAGLAHPSVVDHLVKLGVTAVELLPVHEFAHSQRLTEMGLSNYWGYDTIGYFAPHGDYASAGARGQQVAEFKEMVRTFHQAGIEVFLDVVYNHTAEGNHLGPMLSFKGVDNAAYYRLVGGDSRFYMDYTGTGNSLNMRHPYVLQLLMDSLRYWVREMHVDGFRFDLAATLARGMHEVDRLSAFFDVIQQDPVLNDVKLIAEPWDVGEGGYQVGNFPPLWSEWNGKFRDAVRDYWRGEPATLGEFAYRFTGSSDLYGSTGRRPFASINFVTAHDGFTLRDLVSYDGKHNLANGEQNHDGESHNRSWNCGAEGPSDDPGVRGLRRRQQRNLLASLLLSQGVPMLQGGDELGRTQDGNNNAYCHDSELSWIDWKSVDTDLLAFTRALLSFRKEHPIFRRRRWFQGREIHGSGVLDIGWFKPDAEPMAEENWGESHAKSLGVFLNGNAITSPDARGNIQLDDSFYILFNAHHEPLTFKLLEAPWGEEWEVVLDTAADEPWPRRPARMSGGEKIVAEGRSVQVLRKVG
jgi:isoamylase